MKASGRRAKGAVVPPTDGETRPFVTAWVDLEGPVLRKVRQTDEDERRTASLTRGIKRNERSKRNRWCRMGAGCKQGRTEKDKFVGTVTGCHAQHGDTAAFRDCVPRPVGPRTNRGARVIGYMNVSPRWGAPRRKSKQCWQACKQPFRFPPDGRRVLPLVDRRDDTDRCAERRFVLCETVFAQRRAGGRGRSPLGRAEDRCFCTLVLSGQATNWNLLSH